MNPNIASDPTKEANYVTWFVTSKALNCHWDRLMTLVVYDGVTLQIYISGERQNPLEDWFYLVIVIKKTHGRWIY